MGAGRRVALAATATALLAGLVACSGGSSVARAPAARLARPLTSAPVAPAPSPSAAQTPGGVLVAAIGDVACPPGMDSSLLTCQQAATARLTESRDPAAVLLLGDEQYPTGSLADFRASYAPAWGPLLDRTHPVPGNHEYATPGAAGYFAYFGARAGRPGQGWYSFDLGGWHLVALNSNCAAIGGCGPGSAEERWLRADLAAHPARCTLAYWHHPRFSSGPHGGNPQVSALWDDLVAAGAELVLSGHDHDYERFAPLDAAGRVDAAHGVLQVVVGTGGRDHYLPLQVRTGSETRSATAFGVLFLTLRPDGWSWRFVPAAPDPLVPGSSYTDAGSATCH